jgi:hypothetical protein
VLIRELHRGTTRPTADNLWVADFTYLRSRQAILERGEGQADLAAAWAWCRAQSRFVGATGAICDDGVGAPRHLRGAAATVRFDAVVLGHMRVGLQDRAPRTGGTPSIRFARTPPGRLR